MATKTATVVQPEAADAREEGPDAPLLDSLGAELKKLVQKGKERGYVTYDELNAALPPDEVSSEQIEDTMAMLSEAGVNVVEAEEPAPKPRRTRAPSGSSSRWSARFHPGIRHQPRHRWKPIELWGCSP